VRHHQVDRALEEILERGEQPEVGVRVRPGLQGQELDQEIHIAPLAVEGLAPGRRPEELQAPDPVPLAKAS